MNSSKKLLECLTFVVVFTCVCACDDRGAEGPRGGEYHGTFVFFTRGDLKELREISLPDGVERTLVKFPIDQTTSLLEPGKLTPCGDFMVVDVAIDGKQERQLAALDPRHLQFRHLRDGWAPTCGRRGEFYFYAVEPAVGRISLYRAPLADPLSAEVIISGEYALPADVVVIDDRYVATYDEKRNEQVIFEFTGSGWKETRTGFDCEPSFWRSKTSELVCYDQEGGLRTQQLFRSPGKVLINVDRAGIDAILHYWPEHDAVLCAHLTGSLYSKGHFFREYLELVAIDLATGKRTVLKSDVNFDASRFSRFDPSGWSSQVSFGAAEER